MQRRKRAKKRTQKRRAKRTTRKVATAPVVEFNSLTVDQFCNRQQFSRALFYKLINAGTGPKLLKIGSLTRITIESEREWCQQRQQASPQTYAAMSASKVEAAAMRSS